MNKSCLVYRRSHNKSSTDFHPKLINDLHSIRPPIAAVQPPGLYDCYAALCTVRSYEQFLGLIWQQAAISLGGLP